MIKKKGFCLIEALITLMIFSFVVVALNDFYRLLNEAKQRQMILQKKSQVQQICQRLENLFRASQLKAITWQYLSFANKSYGNCHLLLAKRNLVVKTQAGGQLFIMRNIDTLEIQRETVDKQNRLKLILQIDKKKYQGFIYYD
ncbi:type IV pilus modification PilV family protein [Weissella oryzae]|uniref:type IV pilus modification PilV family protein n=1 Tax=Weissella oryzae TaxID=1129792 RepID=UPI000ACA7C65|nr:type II secretion system protein [Weissella oryzae]